LDDQGTGAFAKDKTVTINIVRTRGGLRVIMAYGQRLHSGKTCDWQRASGSFGTAGHENIFLACFDAATGGVPRFSTGGNRSCAGHCATTCGEVHGNSCCSAVWHKHRDGHWQYAARATFTQVVPRV